MSGNGIPPCDICKKQGGPDDYLTMVNPEGGYGLPRVLACDACLEKAEPGSRMAEIAERVLPRGFV